MRYDKRGERLPLGASKCFVPNVFFTEVPQYTIIYIQAFLYKIDSWTDRAFKGFAEWDPGLPHAIQANHINI